MIQTISVQGSAATSLHNFTFTQSGMDIQISAGSYRRNGTEAAKADNPTTITVSAPAADKELEIWLTASDGVAGFQLVQPGADVGQLTGTVIDRLAWMTVPAGATSLDDVEIHTIQMTAGA